MEYVLIVHGVKLRKFEFLGFIIKHEETDMFKNNLRKITLIITCITLIYPRSTFALTNDRTGLRIQSDNKYVHEAEDYLEVQGEKIDYTQIKNPVTNSEGASVWDCIWFGNYWQNADTNGDGKVTQGDAKEPIKWRVLNIDTDGNAFILSDKLLDIVEYYPEWKLITWEECTLRSFLNCYDASYNAYGIDYSQDGFLNNAFDDSEKEAISVSDVVNDNNPIYPNDGKGGNDTKDKLFCLSLAEAMNYNYGFKKIEFVHYNYTDKTQTRAAKPTKYAKDKEGYNAEAGWWWLRSPGNIGHRAASVGGDGTAYASDYCQVYSKEPCIRPALRINLKDNPNLWSYAGSVCSDGAVDEEPKTKIPVDSVSFNGHSYYLFTDELTFDNAKRYCEKRGGYLASITSKEEDNFLYSYIKRKNTLGAWFGLYYKDGKWNWLSNEKYDYSNWAPGEPSNKSGKEIYGSYYYKYTDGTWNDGSGDAGPFICEWDATQDDNVAEDFSWESLKNPVTSEKGISTWDCIWFGNYWQNKDSNGDGIVNCDDEKEPIKWRLLSIDSAGNALLLSDKLLDSAQYNTKYENVTWETCTLRSYLNSYDASQNKCKEDYSSNGFLTTAFSKDEINAISIMTVKNVENSVYRTTSGGKNTQDKIFCLSMAEAMTPGFGFIKNEFTSNEYDNSLSDTDEDKNRMARMTNYVRDSTGLDLDGNNYASWGLRSPGNNNSNFAVVGYKGKVSAAGLVVDLDGALCCIRPAVRINLKSCSSLWSYAGTVYYDGTAEESQPDLPDQETDDFDMALYRADFMTNPDSSYFRKLQGLLSVETPCNYLASNLDGAPLEYWEMGMGIEILKDPKKIAEYDIKQEDIYFSMIMKVLEDSEKKDWKNTYADTASNMEKLEKNIKTVYEAYNKDKGIDDILKDKDKNEFIDLTAKNVIEDISKTTANKKPDYGTVFDNISEIFEVADTVGDALKAIQNLETLAVLNSDNKKAVTRARKYFVSVEGEDSNLVRALDRAISYMDVDVFDMNVNTIIGRYGGEYVSDKAWEIIWGDIKKSNPLAYGIATGYKYGKSGMNFLFDIDSIVTAEKKCFAMANINKAFNAYLMNEMKTYRGERSEENAKILLRAANIASRCYIVDCDTAIDLCELINGEKISENGLNGLALKLRSSFNTSANDVKKKFQGEKDSFNNSLQIGSVGWVFQLEEDNPVLYNKYKDMIDKAEENVIKRKYTFACPVNVTVESTLGTSYVRDGMIHAQDDVIMHLEGNKKTVITFDNSKYTIKLDGTDVGNMDVTVDTYDSEGMIDERKSYYDIPLTDNLSYHIWCNSNNKESTAVYDGDGHYLSGYDEDAYGKNEVDFVYGYTPDENGRPLLHAEVSEMEEVPIVACVPYGAEFKKWVSSGGNCEFADATSPVTTVKVSGESVTITAEFDRIFNIYSIEAEETEGGYIVYSGKMAVPENGALKFFIYPFDGYAIKDVIVDEKSVGDLAEYEFRNVDRNHTIKAIFVKAMSDIPNEGEDKKKESPEENKSNRIKIYVVGQKVAIEELLGTKLTGNVKYKVPKGTAKINKNGVVTFKKGSDFAIEVIDKKTKVSISTCNVCVEQPKMTPRVKVNLATVSINAGDYLKRGSEYSEEPVWISSKPEIASVDAKTGVVKFHKKGTVKIYAVFGGDKISDKMSTKRKYKIKIKIFE